MDGIAPPARWILAGLILAGCLLRLVALGSRPLHGDEAAGAHLSREVRDTGSFTYRSANRHGPFQYYRGGLAMALTGESDSAIRLPYALSGCLLLFVPLLLRRRLSGEGVILATGLIAFSPSFVYFSRYAIQEIDFVLATAFLIAAGAAFARSGGSAPLAAALLAAGWMVTVKESFLLVGGCLLLAVASCVLLGGKTYRSALGAAARRIPERRGAILLGTFGCLLLLGAAFTDGFRDAAGLGHLARNLVEMTRVGAASPAGLLLHSHPASFYAKILVSCEWPIVLFALLGAIAILRSPRRGAFPLTIALYALIALGVTFLLPYKTPWLLLTPLFPLAILAGTGGDLILAPIRRVATPTVSALLAASLAAALALPLSIPLNFSRAADPSEPIAYHPTDPEQEELARAVRRLIKPLPRDGTPKALISLPYRWPIAWYLRDRDDVFYEQSSIPRDPAGAAIGYPVIVTLDRADPKYLLAFTGSASIPDFSPAGYRSLAYRLIPPDYAVARLWVRSDLTPGGDPQ